MPDLQRYITFGASPRASINLILTARALAFIRGRAYALPQDVVDMARDVMRHRLVLSFEALSDDVSADDILTTVLRTVRRPGRPHEGASERPRPRLNASSSASTGRSSAVSTGCSRATTGRLFRGYGVDLADLREYQPGDDVRYIDWNVTARMDDAVRPRVHRGPRAHAPGSCST